MPFKTQHPLYSVWQGMRGRCRNPRAQHFAAYGGRGITVCPEWDDFARFVADMGPRPDGYSLDRIDNDKGYSSSNCRWATRQEQQRNQRTTRRVTIEGNTYLVAELVHLSGRKHETIIQRAEKGMTYDEVLKKTRYAFATGFRKAIEVRVANQLAATHCKRGHEWSPDNTLRQKGGRLCKVCYRMRKGITNPKTP